MSYESLLIWVLVIVVLAVFAYGILSSSSPGRKLWRDEKGKLVAIGERQSTEPGRLSGHGSEMSGRLQLEAGTYRIDYQFDALTRVALVDANGDETLFIKGGDGTEPMTIPASGSYRLLLEPADEDAAWTLTYRHIGA